MAEAIVGPATVARTAQGWVGLGRTEAGLRRSTLPQRTKAEALTRLGEGWRIVAEPDDELLARAAGLLRAHLAGEPVALDLPLDLREVPEFTRRVLACCRRIPRGATRSYADLAREVGSPRAARAVGQAMRRNPLPLFVPCHRVIGSDGSLVGFAGGEQSLELKAALLADERSGVQG